MRKLLLLFLIILLLFSITGCSNKTINFIGMGVGICGTADNFCLNVVIRPSLSTKADKVYTFDLYEKGKFRARDTKSWDQLEINNNTVKTVNFPLSEIEGKAYLNKDIKGIFSVKIY
jgi:hypothetical protein